MFKEFKQNTVGTDYVVGDIHGCFTMLEEKLSEIHFNPAADRLFSVGDLVDRGPESEQVLDWLEKPWFHAVRGNHDDMAIRWPSGNMDVENYAKNGGIWNIKASPAYSAMVAEAFRSLPHVIELDTAHGVVGIVHAECPFDDWNDLRRVAITKAKGELTSKAFRHVEDALLWERDRIKFTKNSPIANIYAVFVGHTPVKQPVALGNVLYIDTGAGKGGRFTIFNITKWELA